MVALLVYHKNVFNLYPHQWIQQFKNSILLQRFKDFDIFEINYGGGEERIFQQSKFESIEMPTFVHALNHLIEKAMLAGYTCLCNSNVDDSYAVNWLYRSVPLIESEEYDVVASNFSLKYEPPINKPPKKHYFAGLDIKKELENNHNIIGHPGVCYSKRFWENNRYVPEEQPEEDMKLWQRSIDNFKFTILPDFLFTHRIHENAVCRSQNR